MTNLKDLNKNEILKATDGMNTVYFKVISSTTKTVKAYMLKNDFSLRSEKFYTGRLNKFNEINMGMSLIAKRMGV